MQMGQVQETSRPVADAGTFWEQRCDESVRAVGFEPIGEEWPSVYTHEKLQLVLVVYVDDFKMAGPQKNLAQGWSMLRTRLKIGPSCEGR